MQLRDAQPEDFGAISDLLRAAFATHRHSDHTEHLIVERLRAAKALTVSLVAVDERGIVGYVACSPIKIDGRSGDWVGLGPIAVLPDAQRRGIGTRLMQLTIQTLRRNGCGGVVLLGDPEYYRRFGFEMTRKLDLPNAPATHFLSLVLRSPEPEGIVSYHPAFSYSSAD
jgi:putative acetyltransferase